METGDLYVPNTMYQATWTQTGVSYAMHDSSVIADCRRQWHIIGLTCQDWIRYSVLAMTMLILTTHTAAAVILTQQKTLSRPTLKQIAVTTICQNATY